MYLPATHVHRNVYGMCLLGHIVLLRGKSVHFLPEERDTLSQLLKINVIPLIHKLKLAILFMWLSRDTYTLLDSSSLFKQVSRNIPLYEGTEVYFFGQFGGISSLQFACSIFVP